MAVVGEGCRKPELGMWVRYCVDWWIRGFCAEFSYFPVPYWAIQAELLTPLTFAGIA